MMTNLFSMFDPSLSVFSFSWMICLMVVLIFPGLFWFSNLMSYFYMNIFLTVKMEIDYVLKNSMKGCYIFIGSIFYVVSLYNFMAIFPFNFSVTSHMVITLPFAYSLWLGIILFCLASSFKHFLSHLIPTGTPIFLMSFMVLVEILSNLIRPVALTFRLTANLMAGHLIMSLIGSSLISLPFMFLFAGSFIQSLLVFMELGVSLIQAYVFSTLLLLYLSDSEH